jgi:hypothetical protein
MMVGETLRGAREAAPLMPLPAAVAVRQIPEPTEPARPHVPTRAAPAAERCVHASELDELIEQYDLTGRRAEVQACALTGLRLTPTDAAVNSYLAAGARPSEEVGRQESARGLRVLAHVDLSEVAAGHSREMELPAAGSLELLWLLAQEPQIRSTAHSGSALVLFDQDGGRSRGRRRGSTPLGAVHVQLSPELSLPRAWTRKVAEFELSSHEVEAWERLRLELAVRQGVDAAFDEVGGSHSFAVHRLLGYPDERLGQMPIVCETTARGIDLGERPYYEHPLVSALEAASGRWRLLFQLSLDETFGWDWGPNRNRLYVWIDRGDLERADFSRVCAITQ